MAPGGGGMGAVVTPTALSAPDDELRHVDLLRRFDDRLRLPDRHHDADIAQADFVAGLQLVLVDLLAIDQGPAGRAQVDDRDVLRPGDLYDRVHAAHGLIFDSQVRRRKLPDLDDVLGQRGFLDELLPFVDLKCQGNIYTAWHRASSASGWRRASEACSIWSPGIEKHRSVGRWHGSSSRRQPSYRTATDCRRNPGNRERIYASTPAVYRDSARNAMADSQLLRREPPAASLFGRSDPTHRLGAAPRPDGWAARRTRKRQRTAKGAKINGE